MSEGYFALYRKYRPESFDTVVGQEQAVLLLKNSIKQNKISHAYLFCGGRGTGKTSVARIVARNIGCSPEDIIEIDAASNRGIDEIRALRDAVRTMPFSSPYKVYIIDEAHMLTKEAANALLKTLEEPPAHVVFILATTDPEKLPDTIVSRCQKVVFNYPNNSILAKQLQHVALSEGYVLEEPTALLIARHGNASYRDSLGYLEQIFQISKKSIEHHVAASFLGATDEQLLVELLKSFCVKDIPNAMNIIKNIEEKHGNAIRIYDDFIEITRSALLYRISQEKDAKISTELADLALQYQRVISSSLILNLLSKRHLILISDAHGFTAFGMILLSYMEA